MKFYNIKMKKMNTHVVTTSCSLAIDVKITDIHTNLNNNTPTKKKIIKMVQENKNIPQTKIGKSFKSKITQNNKKMEETIEEELLS